MYKQKLGFQIIKKPPSYGRNPEPKVLYNVCPDGSGGLVNRLMTQRDALIQDGLSYLNTSATDPRSASTIRETTLDNFRHL